MNSFKYNIAILSPDKPDYSETFITAHKMINNQNVKFYYGNSSSISIEPLGELITGLRKYIFRLLGEFIFKDKIYYIQYALLKSWKKNNIRGILIEYGTTAARFIKILKNSKIPFIVIFHGFDASIYSVINENEEKYKEVFSQASYIIVVSNKMKLMLIELGCPENKIVYNVYGPSDIFSTITPKVNVKKFIGLGRFVDKKAPYYTILAFYEVLKEFPDCFLVLGGDGLLLNTCKNLVKYLGIEDKVEFVGVLTRDQFVNHLKDSLAYVQHSIRDDSGDMEGTPVSILEASAAGVPIISTIHAGIPDVIKHGVTGLLVEEHDVKGMAKNMLLLLNDKELARTFGLNGKIKIQEQFSMEKHIKCFDDLFAKILNE